MIRRRLDFHVAPQPPQIRPGCPGVGDTIALAAELRLPFLAPSPSPLNSPWAQFSFAKK